jgi:hypothetical protein
MAYIQGRGGAPPKTIAVDFDGTLCEFAFPGIGPVKAGAVQAMKTFKALGYWLIIYSCRTSHQHYDIFGGDPSQPTLERDRVKEMIQFLHDNDIVYDEIDDGSKGKPTADYYIDDKGIRFNDNWTVIQQFVEARDSKVVVIYKPEVKEGTIA